MTTPRFNLRETVRQLLINAGEDGLTQAEIEETLAELTTDARATRHSVSGTLANLCANGVVRRAGKRPGADGRPKTVFAATGAEIRKGDDGRKRRQTREREATPLPEARWPREVRLAVDTLRRRGWGVWPLELDLWEAGGRRTTEELLDLADRFSPELTAGAAEARP